MSEIDSILFAVKKDTFEFSKAVALEDADIDKFKEVAKLYFRENDDNRAENIKKFKSKLRTISPKFVSNIPGNEAQWFMFAFGAPTLLSSD